MHRSITNESSEEDSSRHLKRNAREIGRRDLLERAADTARYQGAGCRDLDIGRNAFIAADEDCALIVFIGNERS